MFQCTSKENRNIYVPVCILYSCWQEHFICFTRVYVLACSCPSPMSPGPSCAVAFKCWKGPVFSFFLSFFPSFFLCAERREYEGNKSAVLGLAELQIHQGFILLCLPLFTFGSHGMSHLSYWGSHCQDIWPEYFIFEVIYPVVCFHFYWCGSFDSLE